MAPQEQLEKPEAEGPYAGPLAAVPSLRLPRRKRPHGEMAWRKTVTQHVPEPWLAARLALQARIAALDEKSAS